MDKYKISIWEDVDNGSTLLEQKIAEIGSDTMTAQHRALDPVLTENANGTHTLTFKMYYRYIDTVTGEEVDNPFISLMVNERKVKLFWKDKWYDFVIKDVTKDSSTKTLNFSCQDLYINELSKNGFNLEFDTELENNMGTIDELAEKVLKGTSWKLGECDTLVQYQEEPLYKCLVETIEPEPFEEEGEELDPSKSLVNKYIYVFYSCYETIQNGGGEIQFLYGETPITTVEGSNVIIDYDQDEDSDWNCYTATVKVSQNAGSLTQYRGRRIVDSIQQVYDSKLGKYVDTYSDGTNIVCINHTTKIETPQTVSNLVLNAENFTNVVGWHVKQDVFTIEEEEYLPVIVQTYYTTTKTTDDYAADGYLKVYLVPENGSYEETVTTNSTVTIYNDGFSGNIVRLPKEGIQCGQKYTFKPEVYTNATSSEGDYPSTEEISANTLFSGYICNNFDPSASSQNEILAFDFNAEEGVWTANTSFSIDFLNENIVSFKFTMPQTAWVKKIEFYPYVINDEGEQTKPNDFVTEAVVKQIYNIYDEDQLDVEVNEREYVGQFNEIPSEYTPLTSTEKVRFINIKESNRFNILQTLAETFNCWAVFEINHDFDTGEIIPFDENEDNGKRVVFKEHLGEDTGLGFVYGIDLRTVSRNLNSTNIVTKTIVKQNANEFGEDGFCTIARAPENYSKENYILDFTYFINQGLLDGNAINRDLYDSDTNTPGIGYFYHLNQINTEYDSIIKDLTFDKQMLTYYESLLTVKQEQLKALNQQIENQRNEICQIVGVTVWGDIDWTDEDIANYDTFINMASAESIMQKQKLQVEQEVESLLVYINGQEDSPETVQDDSVEGLKPAIERLETRQEELVAEKEALDTAFFAKYGVYLQEGTWNSEDYYNDSRYYLDACDVASTSAEPQVSYNISVLRLQALEEFKAKIFHIGDTVFIEDPEFFGYEWKNGIKTPIRKKVLVSQIVSHLENPTQDAITIQNYKTDFEDLFQRITASTQSLQYSSGSYNRAANLVASDGGITADALQISLNSNNNLVYQVMNNSIIQDPTGITLTDLSNPNNKVKITANGLYISSDGGLTWKNAIRGDGVATQYLTAGNIATDKISIYDGAWPTFRWDKDGISAYRFDDNNKYYNTFVRYDQYGIYGIENGLDFTPIDEDDVWDNAKFALTWRGFMLKSNNNGGYVSITSDNDIQVFSGESDIPRIQIGRFENGADIVYGMKITDDEGNKAFWTDETGKVYVNTSIYINNGDITIGLDNTIYRMAEETTTLLPNKIYYTKIAEANEDQSEYIKEIDYTLQYYTRTETEPYEYKEVTDNTRLKGGTAYYTRTGTEGSYEYTLTIAPPLYRQMDSVFNANQNFVVYEDGYVSATNAKIEGIIQSSEGIFGDNAVVITSQGLKAGEVLLSQNGISVPLGNGGSININENGVRVGTAFEIDSLGNGSFSGEVNASTLSVKSGSIGGFNISEGKLTSLGDENFILNGAEGSITAKKITIGNEAKIDDYIKLSDDAYILNPDKYSNIVLALGGIGGDVGKVANAEIKLTTEGILNLGSLILDGDEENSIMHDTANTWYIANGEASFNNVNIRGTLETAIFKPTSIQAAAGAMVFRPSSKFTWVNSNTITGLDMTLKVGDYLVFSNTENGISDFSKYLSVTRITDITAEDGSVSKNYTLNGTISNSYDYCVLMANYTDSEFENDLLIGINSTDSQVSGLFAHGITFNSPSGINSENQLIYSSPLMFLGDLSQIEIDDIKGYGLYGDNVYLHGSLTTQYEVSSSIRYAGLNTISNVSFNKNASDTSPIIFWAGSESTKSEDIQNSQFQVTSNGTVYAQNAYIEGTIKGSNIYASSIHGTNSNEPALTIYTDNASDAISFVKHTLPQNATNNISFSIDDRGFRDQNRDYFIEILYPTDPKIVDINFIGNNFSTNDNLMLSGKKVLLKSAEDNGGEVSVLTFDTNELSWGPQSDLKIATLRNTEINFNTSTNIKNNLKVYSGTSTMEFKGETNGYNLYIV